MGWILVDDFPLGRALYAGVLGFIAYYIFTIFDNVFLNPLAKFPGPILRHAFFIPSHLNAFKGNTVQAVRDLHEKYGNIVRTDPNTLSIIGEGAWKDIYGSGSKKPLPKEPIYYEPSTFKQLTPQILFSDDVDHPRIRRPLSYAFSDSALRAQEPLITKYITILMDKLREKAESNTVIDMTQWLNFCTFDITGDLAFDEPFGSLETGVFDAWIAKVFGVMKVASYMHIIRKNKVLGAIMVFLLENVPALAQARHVHEQYTGVKTERRIAKQTDRKDFTSYIIKNNDKENGMTMDEIKATNSILIIAGSETSATTLSGGIYYLLKNPEWKQKIREEVQAHFKDESEITFTALGQLKVLNAFIQETFRMYPAVPTLLPRFVPKEGATVCGHFIPPGTHLGVTQYAAFRYSKHWANPDKFAPERFLGTDKQYANDLRSELQPFSTGPRNCIGQSLAMAEIRIILARLVWNFDMELEDPTEVWDDQPVFILWQKPALRVKLTAR